MIRLLVILTLPLYLAGTALAQFAPPPRSIPTVPTTPIPRTPPATTLPAATTLPPATTTTQPRPVTAPGALPAAAPAGAEQGTVITAEKLIFDYKKSYAIFEQNVVVDDPGIFLTCDTMEVLFDQNDDVERIVAKGSVRIKQEDFAATSQLATYDVKSGDIVLEINPVVVKGQDILRGGTISYNRFDEKLVTTGGVKMFLLKKEGKGGLPMPGPGGRR